MESMKDLWEVYQNRPYEGDQQLLDSLKPSFHVAFLSGATAAHQYLTKGGTLDKLREEIEAEIVQYERQS